jgi:hypothetical protein
MATKINKKEFRVISTDEATLQEINLWLAHLHGDVINVETVPSSPHTLKYFCVWYRAGGVL